MYRSNRNFSRHRNQNQDGFRNKRSAGFPRRRAGQASFDPTQVVLQSKSQSVQQAAKEEYQLEHQFADFAISNQLKQNIQKRGYTTPTPIQDKIIPQVLNARDVVGIANTGTGKTAAFLIPLIDKVLQDKNQKVLILVPTRELAIQLRDELSSFTIGMRLFSTILIGGSSIGRQVTALSRGQNFVIGTPGRIKDLNQRGKLRFEQFNNIVLDEVDRMLDMGFVHEIKNIINRLPKVRQSLFFSATMTSKVQDIMRGFLTDPFQVSTKTQDSALNVKQDIVKLKGRSKIDLLQDLLITKEFEKVLVFGRTKHGAEKLKKELVKRGFKVDAIHGNKSQGQRQRALQNFKRSFVQALIATDVAARGLDITDVSHVINYDLPESYETYIHRIGRTGRANSIGTALTFVE